MSYERVWRGQRWAIHNYPVHRVYPLKALPSGSLVSCDSSIDLRLWRQPHMTLGANLVLRREFTTCCHQIHKHFSGQILLFSPLGDSTLCQARIVYDCWFENFIGDSHESQVWHVASTCFCVHEFPLGCATSLDTWTCAIEELAVPFRFGLPCSTQPWVAAYPGTWGKVG